MILGLEYAFTNHVYGGNHVGENIYIWEDRVSTCNVIKSILPRKAKVLYLIAKCFIHDLRDQDQKRWREEKSGK